MTKKIDFKKTVQTALFYEYGFKPALKDITLLESSDDKTYIRFKVAYCEYVFESFIVHDSFVFCGGGTITQVNNSLAWLSMRKHGEQA